jgi:hypothetical protein
MTIIFWLCWIIDLLILLVCLYETFMVSSNSSLLIPALLMGILLAASWWLRASSPRLALALAGIPAALLLLFALVYIFASLGRSNWQ